MKTLPAALAAHVPLGTVKLADALKITRTDGQVFGFTSHDASGVVESVAYLANPGLNVTDIVIAANAAVGNLELRTLHDGSLFTTADLLGRVWTNAKFLIFRYKYEAPEDGIEPVLAGTFGECELKLNEVVVELRDLRQYLQQPVGSVSSKTCRYRLGSTDKNAGGLCMKVVSGEPYTMPFAVTDVSSNQVFRDSARTEAADWFGEGEVKWLTGDNAGRSVKVKTYDADGTFTLALPMLLPVLVGDTGTAVSGCRKRAEEDCENKYSNIVNFGGEPHRQGPNSVTQSVASNV